MDYGATIAAAFASPDQKEVEAIRAACVRCIRTSRAGADVTYSEDMLARDAASAANGSNVHQRQGETGAHTRQAPYDPNPSHGSRQYVGGEYRH